MPFFLRELVGSAQRLAARDDGDLVQRIGVRQEIGDQRMAGSLARKIRIPSGALFGLDNLKIGRVSRFDILTLRTTKSPASLEEAAKQKTLLFKGSARQGIRLYPRNVNVAVALSLAAERPVDMELWADPDVTRNTHEVIVSGDFGEAAITVQNVPSPGDQLFSSAFHSDAVR